VAKGCEFAVFLAALIGAVAIATVAAVILSQWQETSAMPMVSTGLDFTLAGGLMSYSADPVDNFRQVGLYERRRHKPVPTVA